VELVAFAVLLLVAEVLGTLGGFGSSMLVMPIAASFLPFEEALGLTAFFHVLSNGAKMLLFRQGFDRRLVLRMGIPAVIGVIVGARLTAFVDGELLELALGIALVAMSTWLIMRPLWKLADSRRNVIAGGGISGFVAGLVGTGGAIRGVALSAFALEKHVFIATSAWIDMGVDLSRTVVYASQGFLRAEVWTYLPVLAVISLLGTWSGRWLLQRVPQERFRTVVLVLVLLVGLYLVLHQYV